MTEQPSLTPHRDAIEPLIAGMTPAENWIEAVVNALTISVHRAIADQRDAGVPQPELLEHLPKIVRGVAINGLAAIGATHPLEASGKICVLASMPDAAPDAITMAMASIDQRAVDGGRA